MVEEEYMPEDDIGGESPEDIPQYEDLKTEVAEREVDLEEFGLVKTATEEEEETTHKTDMQSVLKALTPQYPDKKLNQKLQPVMVARVFPDNLLDSCKMTVLSRLGDFDPDEDVDIWGIILATHNAHSIGYEGRGIVDRLEIAGAARDDELDKLSKELGM